MVTTKRLRSSTRRRLPKRLRQFFWDVPFSCLRWETDGDLIIGRILASGDWPAVRWLRKRAGDQALQSWLQNRRGAGLTPRQLRYWELIFRLPRRTVNRWLAQSERQIWDRRRF
jgi:hypothetical protein